MPIAPRHLSLVDAEGHRLVDDNGRPIVETRSRRDHTLNGLLAGHVCGKCNGGWMSTLEKRTKPFLVPLIAGDREVNDLTKEERVLLGRWTCKTAYALHDASNYTRLVPESHPRHLYRHPNSIHKGVFVFASESPFYDPFTWLQATTYPCYGKTVSRSELDRAMRTSYKISLQFGHLLLMCAYVNDPRFSYFVPHTHVPMIPLDVPFWWNRSDVTHATEPDRYFYEFHLRVGAIEIGMNPTEANGVPMAINAFRYEDTRR